MVSISDPEPGSGLSLAAAELGDVWLLAELIPSDIESFEPDVGVVGVESGEDEPAAGAARGGVVGGVESGVSAGP